MLGQLKAMSLNPGQLDPVFEALVISRLRYALEAYSGNVSAADIAWINAVFRKTLRWGLTSKLHDFQLLADGAVSSLAVKMRKPIPTACIRLFRLSKTIKDIPCVITDSILICL